MAILRRMEVGGGRGVTSSGNIVTIAGLSNLPEERITSGNL